MNQPALRVGLLLDGPLIPGSLAPALRRASEEGIIDIVAGIQREETAPSLPLGRLARQWRHRKSLAYRVLDRLDARRAGKAPVTIVELQDLAPRAVQLQVRPIEGRYTDAIAELDLDRIRALRLDVLIRGGFRVLTGGILGVAPHGVLSFHHGDNRTNRGGPPAVWEVLNDEPTTGIVLQRLSEELDGGRVLARAIGVTQPRSFWRNRAHVLRRTSPMLYRVLRRLREGLSPSDQTVAAEPAWDGYCRPILRTPTNAQIARRLPTLALRYLHRRLRHRWSREQWQLAWQWGGTPEPGAPATALRKYRHMAPPPDRFWADPFPVVGHGRHWIFFEELRYASGKGTICVLEWTRSGPVGEPAVVLEEPWHLSYPQVFDVDGTWFMLPESGREAKVQLYRAAEFPAKWVPDTVLLDGLSVFDATIHCQDGIWYLFGSVAEDGVASDEELHLFTAPRLRGPYRSHPANPIVTDVTRARMAGRLFRCGGELYRPAQNCAPHYGTGINVQRVLELSPTRYVETNAQALMPRWDPRSTGMHTINAAGELSAIDLLRRVRR